MSLFIGDIILFVKTTTTKKNRKTLMTPEKKKKKTELVIKFLQDTKQHSKISVF